MSIFDTLSQQNEQAVDNRMRRAAVLRHEFDAIAKKLAALFNRYDASVAECREVGVEVGFDLDPMLEAAFHARTGAREALGRVGEAPGWTGEDPPLPPITEDNAA